MKWSLTALMLVALFSACVSCTRSCTASFVPKLDLTWRLSRTRQHGANGGGGGESLREQLNTGIAAYLRWQPKVYAAYVPERYELSPSAFLAPCEASDTSCFAEFAEDEREVTQALQEAP
ncbi:MAG: hypothetical protein JWN48_4798 [Myxococcaceae bacterium]|nr:hypothetical protein [Myxococcaceae bacterium]